MTQHKPIRHAVRVAFAAGLTASFGISAAATVQRNPQSPAKLGKVTVTGTRIKRTNIETAQPITHISRQQIAQSGYTNIEELLGQLSFANKAQTSKSNNATSTISLRGLGSNRTLVLVNGKRWIPSLNGVTNLNTIPTSIIDHIEILQDGASAVYGSDAIAGVVNIITVKNFNGAKAHAYYGIRNDHKTGSWDGQVKQYDFTVGGGNDRGNVVFNTTYREQNGIHRYERDLGRSAIAGVSPPNFGGTDATPRGTFELFGPAAGGRTFGQGTCGTYNPATPNETLCKLTLQKAPAPPSLQNFKNYQSSDAYDLTGRQYQQVPDKLVTLYTQGHYDLFNNVTFSANASYIREEEHKTFGPDGLTIGATANALVNSKPIGIAATNPYNPFGVDLTANTKDPCLAAGTCIGLNGIHRRIADLPTSYGVVDHTSDNFHVFAGFNGYVNLFKREIDWDVGFSQDRLQTLETEPLGTYNYAHVARALGPVAQCTSPCVPLNYFGGSVLPGFGKPPGIGSITQAQANYIRVDPHDIHQSNLRDWTVNISSSDAYDLPAGPLGFAIGYERLDNYGFSSPDAVKVAGNTGGAPNQPLNGRVVRNAEYTELNIPLLADLPGVKNLSVDIANRWTQFKRSGGVTGRSEASSFVHNSSGRLNIRYQVMNDLLVRASWSQGFRSPNVSELFSGRSQTYTIFTDPCAPGTRGGLQGGALPPNCPNGTEDVPRTSIQGGLGGNRNLEPEKSISRTLGFVYSPGQVPGLDVNADYFKIELNNAIGTVGFQNIVNGCFNNFTFCNLITVKSNEVIHIRNIDTNVGSLLTEGIDVGLHYKFPSTPVGDFDARINGTFLKAYDQTVINRATKTGFATSHLAGVNKQSKRRFNGYLDWDYGNWSVQYHIEYLSGTMDKCGVSIKGYCNYPNRKSDFQGAPGVFPLGRSSTGDTVYHDVHVDYTVPSINTTFGLGVNNLFDKKPPINGNGSQYGAIHHYRPPSRVVYGSIRVRF